MQSIARLLWIATAACGRVGFEFREGVDSGTSAIVPPIAEFEARCGANSGTIGVIEIENPGDVELEVSSATATNGFAVITQLPIAIPARTRAELEVRAPGAVIGTDLPGAAKVGSLQLVVGGASHTVELVATVTGADFTVTGTNGEQITFDLTGTSGVCPTPIVSQITNTGNVAAGLGFQAQSGFAIGAFTDGPIGPGESKTFTVSVSTDGPCSGVGVIEFVATGDICAEVPTVLQASFSIFGSSTCACS